MLENQLQDLTQAIQHLAESIQANTQAGNRIVQSLSPTPNENAVSATKPDTKNEALLPSNSQPDLPPAPTAASPSTKRKRNRRTKAEIQAQLDAVNKEASATPIHDRLMSNAREQGELNAELKAAENDPFADAADPFAQADEPAKVYRISDVREAAIRLREAKGLVEGRLLLAKYDVETILDLPESEYANFIRDCQIA